jgi:hypothetical protein
MFPFAANVWKDINVKTHRLTEDTGDNSDNV